MIHITKRILFTLIALFSLLPCRTAIGQVDSAARNAVVPSNSISTGYSYVGIDVGLTGTDYIGTRNFLWGIVTNQSLATYLPYNSLGTGIGFIGGIKAGEAISSSFDLEEKFRFLINHTSLEQLPSSIYLDPLYPTSTSSATNNYSLTLWNIDFALLGHVRINDWLYGIGGFSASDLTGNSFAASQTVSVAHGYLRLTTHTTSDIATQQIISGPLDNWFTGFRADAQVGGGAVFRVGADNLLMDVEALVSIPFTGWLTKVADSSLNATAKYWLQPPVTDPRLWYVSLTVGIRLPFHELPPPIPVPVLAAIAMPAPSETVTLEPKPDTNGGLVLSGRVTDAESGKPLSAEMTAVDLSNDSVIGKSTTDSNGNYSFHVNGPGKYSVSANANGHLFGTAYFEVDSEGRILKNHADIALGNLSGGKTRLLVFFDFDKADLQPASAPELNRAVDLMKLVPTLTVEIAGYSDSLGTVQHNMDLSLRRANAVRTFLMQHGIVGNRITTKGYGPQSPIATNATDEGRAENRRVEFVVKEH